MKDPASYFAPIIAEQQAALRAAIASGDVQRQRQVLPGGCVLIVLGVPPAERPKR